MSAGTTTAAQRGKNRSAKGIENMRDENSSVVAGRKPIRRTPAQGNHVPRRFEYGTSAGGPPPRRAAARGEKMRYAKKNAVIAYPRRSPRKNRFDPTPRVERRRPSAGLSGYLSR